MRGRRTGAIPKRGNFVNDAELCSFGLKYCAEKCPLPEAEKPPLQERVVFV